MTSDASTVCTTLASDKLGIPETTPATLPLVSPGGVTPRPYAPLPTADGCEPIPRTAHQGEAHSVAMRRVFLTLACGFLSGGCSDECSSGQQRCDGNRAQYCNDFNVGPGSHNTWSDFPHGADCGAVDGCTCQVVSGTAECRAASPSVVCPHPSCGSMTMGVMVALPLAAAVGWRRQRSPRIRAGRSANRCHRRAGRRASPRAVFRSATPPLGGRAVCGKHPPR